MADEKPPPDRPDAKGVLRDSRRTQKRREEGSFLFGVRQLRELYEQGERERLEEKQRARLEVAVVNRDYDALRGSDIGLRRLVQAVQVELETRHSIASCLEYLHDVTGLTKADVCRKAGIKPPNYSACINGHRIPAEETLTRILDAFAGPLPEVGEGTPAREYLFLLRSVEAREIPKDIATKPESIRALVKALALIRATEKDS